MSRVLAILTNYKSLETAQAAHASLLRQVPRLEVRVWDNSGKGDLFANVVAEPNCGPAAVHRYAGLQRGFDYVLKLDDDVELLDRTFVSRGVAFLDSWPGVDVLGVMGRRLPGQEPFYEGREAVVEPLCDTSVDIVVGKLALYRWSVLEHLPCAAERQEDIQLSAYAPGRKVVPAFWNGGYRDLVKPRAASMSGERGHYAERDALVKRLLGRLVR